MTEELHNQVTRHGAEIAKHGAILDSLISSTQSLQESVKALPDQINAGLNKVYDHLDEHERINRPQIKTIVFGLMTGLTLLLSAFTVILNLTITPIRKEMERHTLVMDHHQERDYETLQRVSSMESTISKLEDKVSDIDHGGRRKWVDGRE